MRPYLARWRTRPPRELGHGRAQLPNRSPARAAPSPRTAARLLLGYKTARDALGDAQQAAFHDTFVKQLCQRCAEVTTAHDLTREFFRIVRERRGDALETWLTAAQQSQIAEMSGFSAGLSRDREAVAAGLSLCWSNGQAEGRVNRLKMIKRQMYGRASFDLLRARVLPREAAA